MSITREEGWQAVAEIQCQVKTQNSHAHVSDLPKNVDNERSYFHEIERVILLNIYILNDRYQ